MFNDADFELSVTAINDGILEGDEKVEVRVLVPALQNFRTGWETVTITEDYRDATTQEDEKTGCSCTCTTCSDGNSVSLKPDTAGASIETAGGNVLIRTYDQDGQKPVVYIGLPLPVGKAVPTQITVQLQVIEELKDASGTLVGLGRKRIPDLLNTSVVTMIVPATATAGSTLWLALQADLSSFVASWNRISGTSSGSNGVTEKIIPIEMLANASFAPTATLSEKYSGWVGRTNHAMRDQTASSLAPSVGQNMIVNGLDRMIRNQNILVPDGTGGKVKREYGSMLFRPNGGTSWFKDNSLPSPDSQDTFSGDTLTDRFGNKVKYNILGDLFERVDAAGNKWTYSYYVDGGIASITDPRGQQTTFVRFVAPSGLNAVKISIINSTTDTLQNESWTLAWQPGVNAKLFVTFDDPDGAAGPRAAREDVYNYLNGALTSIQSGVIGVPSHTTSLSYTSSLTSDGRIASISYPDGSVTSLELSRQRNALIPANFTGSIGVIDPRALRVALPGTLSNPIPNYAVITYSRSAISDPQRTIFQLDHRGRILRSWDPEQVFLMVLHGSGVLRDSSTFSTLQANVDRSYEYVLKPTQRNAYGRITGEDFGEGLTSITPDPDKLATTNGARTRQTATLTYVNNNPMTSQQPIQAQESLIWNDTFDVLTEYTDGTGNKYFQTVNPNNGLVTQQTWGERPLWQNPVLTLDVNHDGGISPLDSLAILNYINSFGSGAPVPNGPPPPPNYYYLDVDGDNFVGPLDVLAVNNWINNIPFPPPPVVNSLQQTDYTYDANAANSVVSRGIFYNDSSFDGNGQAIDATGPTFDDFAAIATDKTALLPGATASFANYTSYVKGINGIFVDMSNLATPPTVATIGDFFQFRVGNNNTPNTWTAAPAATSVTVLPSVGNGGSTRVFITFADNAIQKQWLRVIVFANSFTGLAAQDTHYWGNAIGETNTINGNNANVDGTDVLQTSSNLSGFVLQPVTNIFDFNRDKSVDGSDVLIASSSLSGFSPLVLITAPSSGLITVVSRGIFYNDSSFDGNGPAIDATGPTFDDFAAIATDKTALLPGATASFANYTSYVKGINGIFVDISNLTSTPTLATIGDFFQFRVGNNSTPNTWSVAPAATSVTILPSVGNGVSTRVFVAFADNAIQKQWLQVIVLANASTGLAEQDTHYWGNAIGETNTISGNFAIVDSTDALLANSNPSGFVLQPVTNIYDFNRDKLVNSTDFLIANSNPSGFSPLVLVTAPTTGLITVFPKRLVATETIKTGRTEGDHVIAYAYINNPADPARHGKLSSWSESTPGPTGGIATTVYTYDDRGNLNSSTDAAGRVTKLWFDNRDRLIASLSPDPDGSGTLLPVLMRYDYDVLTTSSLPNSSIPDCREQSFMSPHSPPVTATTVSIE